ncbi:microtubule-associated protein futsch [Toxorhynchites rutilus septentrionalis]|uniref:microtubule-associated protein futsch n=1 Tax=Toxorhynchites rutilus septentrionalis TaxID=329112 RepID=UPI00247A0A07|nr:microtubule-associated protein futsch [Toxorhynchites rutilus septentrionalis]
MSGDQSGPIELNGTDGVVTNGGNDPHGEVTMNGGSSTPGGGGGSDAGGAGSQNAVDAGCSDGPPSIIGVGPPSPLTGCYLLIVVGEPHSQDHKDIILQRLTKGFLSWDVSECHVDLEEELQTITLQALEGEEGKHGERLIQYASENLVTEILIHPQINTFVQCIRNLLSSFTRHRHIIHTGYTFTANGSWILQDGTFSVVDFLEAFQEHEVQRVLRAYPDTITMDVHCAPVGNWASIQDKTFARLCRIRLNPVDVLSSGSDKLNAFVDYLASMIVPTEISELLESSDVVGNIRFSHPTLYVFPGGQGDAALFGINGFNMLVDGGFSRKSCFWDFVRHLDRLDAVLMTRINNTNIKGISAVVERKNEAHVYPQIGHFFCNIPERKSLLSPDGDKDRDPLLVDLIEEGHQIVTNLKSLNLKAQNCYRDVEPINLYHKVGHGTLDMYVISPAKDSKEVKEFLAKWNAADPKLFTPKDSKDFNFPIQNIISVCALLVWTPANPDDNITRILFPGSAPEYKILEGLEKMKNVEFMRNPVCTVKSIAPSISTQAITKKSLKSSSIDKIMPEPILPSKSMKQSAEKDNKLLDSNKMKIIDNKLADANKDIMDSSAEETKLEKQLGKSTVATVAAAKIDAGKLKAAKTKSTESVKKIDNKLIESSKKIELEEKKDSASDAGSEKDDTERKASTERDAKTKEETSTVKEEANKAAKKAAERPSRQTTTRSRIDSKPPKATTKAIKKKDETIKSSPTTPKKTAEPKLTNGVSEKKDEETKKTAGPPRTTKPISSKPGKSSPKSTPAKSAKDANNRKVLEARQRPAPKTVAKKEAAAPLEKKETPPKIERKPISRRPKGAAPVGAVGGSPIKAKKLIKSEKDAVIRKAKLDKNGTTDSSLVSTPSADEAGVVVQKHIADTAAAAVATSGEGVTEMDPTQQQKLAELKEEQEAVREIEAVFKRDSEKAKRRDLLSEHREIQDSATEPEEEEEYLIIEKEEQYTEDSINEPESSATKEEEIQKHQRDSEESEKRKRDSLEGEKEEKADIEKVEGETAEVVEIIEGEKETEPVAEVKEDAQAEDKESVDKKDVVEEVKEEPKEGEKLSPKHKQDLEEEVQEIIASAEEIAKSKMATSMDGLKTEEISSISPDEKISSTKKTSDTRDENEPEPVPKEHIEPPHESHHEERVSATAESGATTTAPTLPEDERIPLDEIKEDLVIEEKHVKEETKEVEVAPPAPTVYEPMERPTPAKMHFSAQQPHMRDVVKTPDEVADLPVHEEADFEEYSEDKDKEDEKERYTKEKPEVGDAAQKKPETDVKEQKKTDKVVVDKSAESDKLCDTVKDVQQEEAAAAAAAAVEKEVQEVVEKVEKNIAVDKPPKLDTQASPAKDRLDEETILKDLESQILPAEVEIKAVTAEKGQAKAPQAEPVEQEADEGEDDEDKESVHEEIIVAKKVEPKVPVPAESSVLDEIWAVPEKAEEKLEELKQVIDDKAKETTSDLVAIKDEMVRQIADRKEEIVDIVKTEVVDVDKKVKESVAELGKEAEKVALEAADDVLKGVAAKADAVSEDLRGKAQQLDDTIVGAVEVLKQDVEQVAVRADEALSTIVAEKKELEKHAKDIKEEVAEKLDEGKKQLEEEINKTVEQAQEKAKSGISSFFGGITNGIKSGIEKIADKVETKIKDKTDQMEVKLQEVTDKIEDLKGKEVEEICEKKELAKGAPSATETAAAFETPFGYERSFTQELRETHITTVDSPVSDVDKISDIKAMVNIPQHIDEDKELEELEAKQMSGSFVIEEVKYSSFEDANLRDIKEEDEEDRVTPPQKDDKKTPSPKLDAFVPPQRARTPEDVAKIVANVAEVLKSDKDLEEIIPDFDPNELERKLSQGVARDEDVSTVQRMLVTASSEDGGEETVICPAGTITFSKSATPEPQASGRTTPEIKVDEDSTPKPKASEEKLEKPQLPEVKPDEKSSPASSGKSSPDLKTSPTSIEEKDKHELPEKVVVTDAKKSPAKTSEDRKESIEEQYEQIDDSRRESAISTFSERDYTKDESSIIDERDSSRAHSISSYISDIREDAADAKSASEFLKDSDKQDEKVDASVGKQKEELSSPESIVSQRTVSEQSTADAGKAVTEAKATPETEEKKSIPTESVSEEKASAGGAKEKDASRPASAASHVSETAPVEAVNAVCEEIRPAESTGTPADSPKPDVEESTVSKKTEESPSDKSAPKIESKEVSLESPTPSKVAEKVPAEETKEASRPASAASHLSEKTSLEEAKEAGSRPESVASHVSEKAQPEEIREASRPESVASHVSEKVPSEKVSSDEAKEASRPESVGSHVDEKATSVDAKETSRPQSAASHVSEKAPLEDSKDASRPESAQPEEPKEPSRPVSAASHVSEKAPSEKAPSEETKEASRPESAASHVSEKPPSVDGKEASQQSVSEKTPSEDVKETSRPESVASHVSEKAQPEEAKEASRPVSVASHTSEKAPSEKDTAGEAKEVSRPESAASHVSEKVPSDKSEPKFDAKDAIRPESVTSHVSEKEVSRPESAASHVSEIAEEAEKKQTTDSAKSIVEKETSRPESVASHTSEKVETEKLAEPKEASRPVSVASDKTPSEKSAELGKAEDPKKEDKADSEPIASKDQSRRESAVSHVSDKEELKLDDKQESRPASAASHISEKTTSDEKKSSQPESVATHAEEKPSADKPAAVEEPAKPDPTLKSDEKVVDEKETEAASRPESVASHVSEPAPSEQLEVPDKPEDKEKSSSESVASHVDEKASEKGESRPESVASSHVSEKASSDKSPVADKIDEKVSEVKAEEKITPTETSQSKSPVASETMSPEKSLAADEKEKPKSEEKPIAADSKKDEVIPEKAEPTKASEGQVPTQPEHTVSDKPVSEKPAVVADQEVAEPITTKPVDKADAAQDVPRPESATSDKSPAEKQSVEDDMPTKVSTKPELTTADNLPETEKAAGPEPVPKTDEKAVVKADVPPSEPAPSKAEEEKATILDKEERPQSATSDKLVFSEKESSRPDSATSDGKAVDEKEAAEPTKPEPAVDSKSTVEKTEPSRPTSAASHVSEKDDTSPKVEPEKEPTRPSSVASHVSENEVSEAAAAKTAPEVLESAAKEESRPASVASDKTDKSPAGDGQSQQETAKEPSRPESAASLVGEKEKPIEAKEDVKSEQIRPESAASHVSEKSMDDVKVSGIELPKESAPSAATEMKHDKETKESEKEPESSRPASVASHVSDKLEAEKAPTRPESAASHVSEKDKEVTVKSEDKALVDKPETDGDFSRPESPASCCSDKAVIPPSEPESSHLEKDLARPDSAASYHGEPIPDEKAFSRPESPASCAEEKDEAKSAEVTTTESTKEEIVEIKTKEGNDGKDQKPLPEETGDYSRPESPASCGDDTELPPKAPESSVPEKDLARPDSAASYHGEPIKDEKQFSRPESPASCGEDGDATAGEKTTGEPLESEKSKSELKVDEKHTSRPSSAASHVSDKSVESKQKPEESLSQRESASKEERRRSSVASDHGDDIEEKIFVKDSRSKSLASVLSSTTQRIGLEASTLGVLAESTTTSRDDLDILKSPRDSVTKIDDLRLVKDKSESKIVGKPLFEASEFPIEEPSEPESEGFPIAKTDDDVPETPDSKVPPAMVQLLKESESSMKEIEKMSTAVTDMIKELERKEEPTKPEEKTLSFPLFDSGKSTPLSTEKDKSQTSSIKSTSPHDRDSLEESSVSLNTFIEKDSLSESATKHVTITTSATEDSSSQSVTTSVCTKVEHTELLGGTKTPPTAPISPNVSVKEGFSLAQHVESTIAGSPTMTTVVSSSGQMAKQHKDDVSGVSTPKESVPSGKSSPGLMSVHTGSTDSASKSINLGQSSGIETSDSSPKPTSPFPKIVDTLKTDDVKTSSGMSTPDMTRTSTPDVIDSQIERIPDDKQQAADGTKTVTTTATTTTSYVIKDGEQFEIGSTEKTETTTDSKKDDVSSAGESLSTSSVTTTTTTTKVVKEAPKTPANLSLATTEDRSLAEEYDEKEVLSPRSDISSGQASRIVAGWHDEDAPGSPLSVTSQAPLSPSTKYTYDYDLQHSSSGVSKKSDIEIDDSQDELPPQYGSDEVKSAITIASAYKPDPMSTSFYGQLPDISDTPVTSAPSVTKSTPIPIAAGRDFTKTYMEYASSGDSSLDSTHRKMSGERKYLDEADLDFDKTFTKSNQIDLMTTSMHFSSDKEFMAATTTSSSATTTIAEATKKELDFTASGLPTASSSSVQAQTTVTTTALSSTTTVTTSVSQSQSEQTKDTLASWGKPLGLPSPAAMNDDNNKTTPKKERKMMISAKTKLNNEKNLRKRSESPIKASKKAAPVYVDLSYVPHHGNSYYANVEFFKRVRARYYVFSGTEPSREVYNALLEAKQTWEDKDLEVTIIPTYDTDVLGYWVSENEDLLAKYHIDLSPSAARCTINLQDHETSCSAYRLEF